MKFQPFRNCSNLLRPAFHRYITTPNKTIARIVSRMISVMKQLLPAQDANTEYVVTIELGVNKVSGSIRQLAENAMRAHFKSVRDSLNR